MSRGVGASLTVAAWWCWLDEPRYSGPGRLCWLGTGEIGADSHRGFENQNWSLPVFFSGPWCPEAGAALAAHPRCHRAAPEGPVWVAAAPALPAAP